MATLDWSQCPVVESIPGKVSGAWVFRGTRVPVSAIFENLKSSPIEEVLEISTSRGNRFRPCWTSLQRVHRHPSKLCKSDEDYPR